MISSASVSDKALEARYRVSISNDFETRRYGETRIKPACMEIVRIKLGPNEVKKVSKVSLSVDTVKRRIDDMASLRNIDCQIEKGREICTSNR